MRQKADIVSPTNPKISRIHSLKISRTTFLNCMKCVAHLRVHFFFSKVTGVNHKIKFPAPRAHTVALCLACPMSKPGLVTPRRAQAQGSSVLSDPCIFSLSNCEMFGLKLSVQVIVQSPLTLFLSNHYSEAIWSPSVQRLNSQREHFPSRFALITISWGSHIGYCPTDPFATLEPENPSYEYEIIGRALELRKGRSGGITSRSTLPQFHSLRIRRSVHLM